MSFVAALVLLSVVALVNSDCLPTLTNAVLNTPNAYNTISAGSSASATCLPGFVLSDYPSTSTTYSVACSSASVATYSGGSSTFYGGCIQRQDWCPATINSNFGNTSTVTFAYARYMGNSVRLICKPTGLGRNWKGNGTSILVYCASLADGSGGVWASEDWCSGALGVSANLAVLALAAVAGLLYKRFF